MWVIELGGGLLFGAFLALTPIPLLTYMFWVALRTLLLQPHLRWYAVVHVLFNFGFALLPLFFLWLAFRQSMIAGVALACAMYFPYWGIPMLDRLRNRHST